jgi:hypothetical protein
MTAEQKTITALRTNLGTMKGIVTNEAPTRGEEQVGVMIRQTGKGIKGSAVDGHKDGRGEARTMIKLDPMSIVVI